MKHITTERGGRGGREDRQKERNKEGRKDIYEESEEKRTRRVERPVVKIFAPIGAAEEWLKRELRVCNTMAQKNVAL